MTETVHRQPKTIMFNDIPTLDRKGLRDFGLITGAIFAGIFGILLPWKFGWQWPLWPWVLFTALGTTALAAPMSLRPVYNIWMRFGLIMGSIMSRIILGLVFFLVVTPVGLLMRTTGKDPMRRQFDRAAPTYRDPIGENRSNSFDKPF